MVEGTTYTARLKRSDRPFLEEEAYRITREGFAAEGRLMPPSTGEVVSELFAELRELREEVHELRERVQEQASSNGRG